jgi:hypothetical protein
LIEIELGNGHQVRVGSDVSRAALRRVLAALRGGDRWAPSATNLAIASRRISNQNCRQNEKYSFFSRVGASIRGMEVDLAGLPDDLEAQKSALLAERAQADAAQTGAPVARAEQSAAQALIVHLKLQIEKPGREIFGPRSERRARLLDQMELHLEELEASATENELKVETAAAKTTNVAGVSRKRPSRQPFPEHLPRERVIVPGPTNCLCCGGARLSKPGEILLPRLRTDQPGAGTIPCDRARLGEAGQGSGGASR